MIYLINMNYKTTLMQCIYNICTHPQAISGNVCSHITNHHPLIDNPVVRHIK